MPNQYSFEESLSQVKTKFKQAAVDTSKRFRSMADKEKEVCVEIDSNIHLEAELEAALQRNIAAAENPLSGKSS